MNALMSRPEIQVLGWSLLHFLWQGALVAAALAVALALLRPRASTARYAAACTALAVMAACPLATAWFIGTDGPALPPAAPVAQDVAAQASPPAGPQAATAIPALEPVIPAQLALAEPTTTWQQRAAALLPWLVAAWAAGVVMLAARLVAGWTYLRIRWHRTSRPAEERWQSRLRAVAQRIGVQRCIRLLECAAVESPAVIGWLKPVILLPASAMSGLSVAQWDAILAHELAHIRRHDYLVNLVQSVIETLLFYHPAVWWVSKVIRQQREICCDDIAAEQADSRFDYARALATLEEQRHSLTLAAGGGQLLGRIRRLLMPELDETPRPAWPTSLGLALLLAVWVACSLTVSDASALSEPTSTMQIQALDAEGRPVAGAEAYMAQSSPARYMGGRRIEQASGPILTDGEGIARAEFNAAPPGAGWSRKAYVRVPGQSAGAAEWWAGADDPAPQEPITVTLKPSVTVRGRVEVRGGKDAATARVRLLGANVPSGGPLPPFPSLSLHSSSSPWPGALDCAVNADGTFALPDLPPGGFTVAVTGPGLNEDIRHVPPQGQVSLELDIGGVIAGRLVHEQTGQPVPGVLVGTQSHDAQMPVVLTYTSRTDADGRFRIEGLREAGYTVALAELLPDAVMVPRLSVWAMAGEVTQLELKLEAGTLVPVQVVDDETDQPLSGVQVSLSCPDASRSAHMGSAQTDGAGLVHLRLPAGGSRVSASAVPKGYRYGRSDSASVTVASGRPVPQVVLRLPKSSAEDAQLQQAITKPNATIRGRVVDKQGRPVAGILVSDQTWYADRPQGMYLGSSLGQTNQEGIYEARVVAGVRHQPQIRQIDYAMAEGPIVTPKDGETLVMEDLIIEPKPVVSQATGIVTDPQGRPLARAYTEFLPLFKPSDDEGRIRVELRDAESPFNLTVMKAGYETRDWCDLPPGAQDLRFTLYPTTRPQHPIGMIGSTPLPDPRRLIGQPAPPFTVEQWVVLPDGAAPLPQRTDGRRTILMFVGGCGDPDELRALIEQLEQLATGRSCAAVVIASSQAHPAGLRAMLGTRTTSAAIAVDGYVVDTDYTSRSRTAIAYGLLKSPTLIVIDADGTVRAAQSGLDGLAEVLSAAPAAP